MEKIHLDEKRIIGFTAETSNSSPDMQQVINRLWQRLFAENAAEKIEGKLSLNPIGLYSDYAFSSGNTDARNLRYDVTAGFETDFNAAVPVGMAEKLIPAGEYAVFSAVGGAEAAAALWQEIWNTPLDRRYSGDFELYCGENGTVKIFIALN